MNKEELINSLKEKFESVDEVGIHKGKTEAGITVWGIGVFDKVGDVIRKLNLTFYTKGVEPDSVAFWGVSEPKPVSPVQNPTFRDRVLAFIKTKMDSKVIKFGYIEQMHETANMALGVAIMPDKSEKKVLVKESEGIFSLEVL